MLNLNKRFPLISATFTCDDESESNRLYFIRSQRRADWQLYTSIKTWKQRPEHTAGTTLSMCSSSVTLKVTDQKVSKCGDKISKFSPVSAALNLSITQTSVSQTK